MRTLTMLKVPAGFIAAVLAVASLAPAAQSQALTKGFAAKIYVPFAFETAVGQHFAPGLYTITRNGEKDILIRGAKTSGLLLTHVGDSSLTSTEGKALFTHYGDRYFLRGIWVAGNSNILCGISKAERHLQVADAKTPATVQLAMLQPER